ncbi:hypothetical protein SmJEL517_g02315 [Synchytrium microbalum]|uniref:Nucleolar protein 14 n=1 Tax=Synchytrium microbalum TaxID=1806994 RepID=A0A507C7K4_9FUNG|nr:uncharacterized protein SmJEL517_g02315 [Synchytrium microbalum]TPX35308.1 hypothetical protein SmJEL517_g02315 [Synchytrium microbalum]
MPSTKRGPSALKKLKDYKKTVTSQYNLGSKGKNKRRPLPTDAAPTGHQPSFPNLFELQVNKAKHHVLNRHVTGSVGRPAAFAKKAGEVRRKTLGQELKSRKKDTAFIDNRFGEFDAHMTLQDKVTKTAKKQQRNEKSSLFNLEEENLTHLGQSLDDLEDLNGGFERVDSDDDGQVDKKFVKDFHFGGFDKEKDARLSKSDVMKEVIAKSKHHKALRQKEHEDDIDLMDQVDAELDDIRALLGPQKNHLRARFRNESEKQKQASDDYDQVVKSLVFESRATPSDRIKSSEEIKIAHDRKMLELEADRVRRMKPDGGIPIRRETQADDLDLDYTMNDDEIINDDGDDTAQDSEKIRAMSAMPLTYVDGKLVNNEIFMKKKRKRQDDEDENVDINVGEDQLESDASDEDDGSATTESGEEDDEDMEGDGEEAEFEESEVDVDDVADVENADGMIEDQEVEEEAIEGEQEEEVASAVAVPPIIPKTIVAKAAMTSEANVASLPSIDLDDFVLSFKPKKLEKQLTQLREACKGKPANIRETLYFRILDQLEATPLKFKSFDVLAQHVIVLARLCPSVAMEDALRRLTRMEDGLKSYLSDGWPSCQDLLLIRLFGLIFPTTDFDHPVITPMVLLLCRFLSLVRVNERADVIAGLFLCNLLLDFQSVAKRYLPEVMPFLVGTLQQVSSRKSGAGLFELASIDSSIFENVDWTAESIPLDLRTRDIPDGMCVTIVETTLRLISAFSQLWSENPAHPEIFSSVHKFAESLSDSIPFNKNASFESSLFLLTTTLSQGIEKAVASREPLKFKSRKPVAIPTFMPKFEEGYSLDRRYNPERAFVEKKKLEFLHRKEFRGAVRELKKDAAFIATESLRAKKEASEVYNAKMKRIMGQLGGQEGDARKFERSVANKKQKRR